MMFNKSQIAVVESFFIVLILLFSVVFFTTKLPFSSQINYQKSIDSLADSIYYSEDFRDLLILENLAIESKSENWNSFELFINNSILNYDLVISNGSVEKQIYSCEGDFKDFAQRVIAIENNTVYEFRVFRLGVCY